MNDHTQLPLKSAVAQEPVAGAWLWEPGRFGEQVRALVLAAIPLFAGFLTILVDDRWRGVHDMIAGTVVIGVADPPLDRSRDERAPGSPHPR